MILFLEGSRRLLSSFSLAREGQKDVMSTINGGERIFVKNMALLIAHT